MYVYYVHHGGLTRESHTQRRIDKYAIFLLGWLNYFHYKAWDEININPFKWKSPRWFTTWLSYIHFAVIEISSETNFHLDICNCLSLLGLTLIPLSKRAPGDLPCVFVANTWRRHYQKQSATDIYIYIYIYILCACVCIFNCDLGTHDWLLVFSCGRFYKSFTVITLAWGQPYHYPGTQFT